MGKPILQPFNGPFQLFQASRSMRSSQGNQTQNQSYPHWILRTSCLLYTQCHMWINCSSLIWIKIKGMISRAQKYHSSEGGQWQCSNLVLNLPMFKASQRFWNWLWIPRRLKREYIFAIGQFPLAKLPASYICIYIFICHICIFGGFLLSTTKTQNAKRMFRNAFSERRGVFSGFMDPRSVRILFLLPAKRIRCVT